MKKNLILTGMMGVGKSTIGKSLSKRLKMKFIDTDKLIEKQENMNINEIFEKKGEKYFRDVEKKLILSSIEKNNKIIALGGGAFMISTVRNSILKKSVSFWLDLDISKLIKRLKISKKRPLLNNTNLEKTVKEIYSKRKSTYSLANFKINCNEESKTVLVEKIIKLYESIQN